MNHEETLEILSGKIIYAIVISFDLLISVYKDYNRNSIFISSWKA